MDVHEVTRSDRYDIGVLPLLCIETRTTVDGTSKSFRLETPHGRLQCIPSVLFDLARITGEFGFVRSALPTVREIFVFFQVTEFDVLQAFKFSCNRKTMDPKFTYMVSSF
jgi:hypothetical protein